MKGLRSYLTSVLAALLCGCGQPDLATQAESSDYGHIRYWRQHGATVCGGTVRFLDAYASAVAAATGSAISPRIDYFYLPTEVAAKCEATHVTGCALTHDSQIWSKSPMLLHELVHAVVDADHDAAPFLQEGLAAALSDTRVSPVTAAPADLPSFFGPKVRVDARLTEVAAALVAYLINSYGLDGVMRVHRASSTEQSFDQVDALLRHEYVAGFQELYRQAALAPKLQRVKFSYCSTTEFTPFADDYQGGGVSSCAASAIGPADDVPSLPAVWTQGLEFEASTASYRLDYRADSGSVSLSACQSDTEVEFFADFSYANAPSGHRTLVFAELPRDSFVLRYAGPVGPAFNDELRVRSWPSLAGSCEQALAKASVISLVAPEVTTVGLLTRATGATAIAFGVAADQSAVASWPGDDVQICNDACVCQAVRELGTYPLRVHQNYVLLAAARTDASVASIMLQ